MTLSACEQVPISVPSGEQIDCPGVEQKPVEAPVEAVLEDGAAPELDALLSPEGASEADAEATIEGEGATAGAGAPDWAWPDEALDEPSGAPALELEADPEDPEPEPELEAEGADPEPEELAPDPDEDKPEPEPELAPDPDEDEPEPEPEFDEPEAPQLPVGGKPLYPVLVSTDCPGSGN